MAEDCPERCEASLYPSSLTSVDLAGTGSGPASEGLTALFG